VCRVLKYDILNIGSLNMTYLTYPKCSARECVVSMEEYVMGMVLNVMGMVLKKTQSM